MNENWKFSDIPYTSPDVEALQTRYDALTRRAREAQSPEELVEIVRQRDALQQNFTSGSCRRPCPGWRAAWTASPWPPPLPKVPMPRRWTGPSALSCAAC